MLFCDLLTFSLEAFVSMDVPLSGVLSFFFDFLDSLRSLSISSFAFDVLVVNFLLATVFEDNELARCFGDVLDLMTFLTLGFNGFTKVPPLNLVCGFFTRILTWKNLQIYWYKCIYIYKSMLNFVNIHRTRTSSAVESSKNVGKNEPNTPASLIYTVRLTLIWPPVSPHRKPFRICQFNYIILFRIKHKINSTRNYTYYDSCKKRKNTSAAESCFQMTLSNVTK